jgi:hypothetical protein
MRTNGVMPACVCRVYARRQGVMVKRSGTLRENKFNAFGDLLEEGP